MALQDNDTCASGEKDNNEYDCRRLAGMTTGRAHHWLYGTGEWKEKKVAPEKWEIVYNATKRRADRAPESSGAQVGSAYHWFVLAHQYEEKINANEYATRMVGLKYKLSHKRAGKVRWNASGKAQKRHLAEILKCLLAEFERDPEQLTPVPLKIEYNKKLYEGMAVPVPSASKNGTCCNLDITLNKKHIGIIHEVGNKWKINELKSRGLANAIGTQISRWYDTHNMR